MTSGDLLADRRLAFGLALRAEGDMEGALSLVEQALELAPAWPAARFALAEIRADQGRVDEAVAGYRAYLALDPADSMGAGVRLGLLGASAVSPRLPDAYVRTLFDQYAGRYEESLVGKLAYRAPALLRSLVDAERPPHGRAEAVLDLGCGTGLCGEAFHERAGWLEGVDLSPQMIAAAARKQIYDQLHVAEMTGFLAAAPRRYDLVLAADALVYLGDLQPVFDAAAPVLEQDGLFALTLQRGGPAGYALGPDQRYAHAPRYVRDSARAAGLRPCRMDETSYRTEKAQPVPALLMLLRRDV